MDEVVDISSTPTTSPRRPASVSSPPISAPPSQIHSPSLTRSPFLSTEDLAQTEITNKTPKSSTPKAFRTPRFTPLGSPIRRALHLTRLDPRDAWLPLTESRNGNAYYAAFHTLCSGIGIQALVLPVALTILGWTWGIISLTLAFIWQLYTLYLLVELHESTETGLRYSRYMQLCSEAFGDRLAVLLAGLPIMDLSAGTCVALIIIGGSTSKMFYDIVCGATCAAHQPLTSVEWFLVFTTAAVVLSQLPNLNSVAGVSLIGAITAIGYCTLIWVVSVAEGRLPGVSYKPVKEKTQIAQVFGVLNALGIVSFAFRGHNLILEIQGTMPSSEKHPSRVPMRKGVTLAYILVAMCIFPITIGGYWAYGQMIPPNGGMLTALYTFHTRDTSRFILGLTSLFVIISSLSSFQIYGMTLFDFMESWYVKRKKQPCSWWLRAGFRTVVGYLCFFAAVATPFLSTLAGLVGGIALPITLAYPCFMWVKIKKPKMYSLMWCLNWGLGILGMTLSGFLTAAGIYVIIETGIEVQFFKP
ncbi:lysine histidine transporter-like 8 [Juglans microcarpa x Juglans regia]|uniref:lysine histidine transporter-like 8 n=1 Tax=Juglans microcarpa x Juglans regia TaxID=2249226 RepID=UPI001B7DFEFC|nr:lysine histidine transporter-like 8 [Juglans microcarpa x Juglans regia]